MATITFGPGITIGAGWGISTGTGNVTVINIAEEDDTTLLITEGDLEIIEE